MRGGHDFFRPGERPVRLTAGPMNFSQAAGSLSGSEVFAIGSLPRAEVVEYDTQSGEFAPYLSGISAEGWIHRGMGGGLPIHRFPMARCGVAIAQVASDCN
jgi:hypothetical protein